MKKSKAFMALLLAGAMAALTACGSSRLFCHKRQLPIQAPRTIQALAGALSPKDPCGSRPVWEKA